MFNYSTQ